MNKIWRFYLCNAARNIISETRNKQIRYLIIPYFFTFVQKLYSQTRCFIDTKHIYTYILAINDKAFFLVKSVFVVY
jgi:hypothetical protein